MRFKRLVSAILISSVLSVLSISFGGSLNITEDNLKKNPQKVENQKMSLEEIAQLKDMIKQAEKRERDIDKRVGKIIDDFLENKNKKYEIKSVSVEKDDRISTMYKIDEIIDRVEEKNKGILKYYFRKYSEYAGDKELLEKRNTRFSKKIEKEERNNSFVRFGTVVNAASYSITDAVDYAHTYALSYNTPTYPNVTSLGGDCTNFVSQALKAGGKVEDSTWYIDRKNTQYLTPTTIPQLDYSWDLADPSPWISADQFKDYWSAKVYTSEFDENDYLQNHDTYFTYPHFRGDAVQILVKNFWWYEGYHTMMITAYGEDPSGDSDFLVTYHTSNKKDKLLADYVISGFQSAGYNDFKLKFYAM